MDGVQISVSQVEYHAPCLLKGNHFARLIARKLSTSFHQVQTAEEPSKNAEISDALELSQHLGDLSNPNGHLGYGLLPGSRTGSLGR